MSFIEISPGNLIQRSTIEELNVLPAESDPNAMQYSIQLRFVSGTKYRLPGLYDTTEDAQLFIEEILIHDTKTRSFVKLSEVRKSWLTAVRRGN